MHSSPYNTKAVTLPSESKSVIQFKMCQITNYVSKSGTHINLKNRMMALLHERDFSFESNARQEKKLISRIIDALHIDSDSFFIFLHKRSHDIIHKCKKMRQAKARMQRERETKSTVNAAVRPKTTI